MGRVWRVIDADECDYVMLASVRQTMIERRSSGQSPDTVLVARPPRPGFVCGYHVDPERALNLGLLEARGVPWGRALTSGGVGFADSGSVLCGLWIGRDDPAAPRSVSAAYAAFAPELASSIEQALGLRARYRPLNDVEVLSADGVWRKPGFCSFSADAKVYQQLVNIQVTRPDLELMAEALRLPPEKFADKVTKSVTERATWLTREMPEAIPFERVRSMLLGFVERTLEVRLVSGSFCGDELEAIQAAIRRSREPGWLLARSSRRVFEGCAGVIGRVTQKIPGGPLIEVMLQIDGGHIAAILITGSLTASPFLPQSPIEALEERLRGSAVSETAIRGLVESIYAEPAYEVSGVTPSQMTAAILRAVAAARETGRERGVRAEP